MAIPTTPAAAPSGSGLNSTGGLYAIGAIGNALNAVSSDMSGSSAAAPAAAPVATAAADADGAACYLRPGDPGFEECEACQ